MSEHKIGEFVREHKKAEIAAAAGVLITAGIAAGIDTLRRHKRHMGLINEAKDAPIPVHELPLEERVKLFDGTTDEDFSDVTKVAAFIFRVSGTYAEKAASEAVIAEQLHMDPAVLRNSLASLKNYSFIESAELHSDKEADAWTAAYDLIEAEARELSMPLLLAISEQE